MLGTRENNMAAVTLTSKLLRRSILSRIYTKYLNSQYAIGVLHESTVASTELAKEEGLTISENCVKQLHKMNIDNKYLRVIVEGGGCSGFQYKFEIDETVRKEDRIFERDGAKVVVDEMSLDILKGSQVDYMEELIRSSFCIVNNPRAEQGCSCGVSFSLKLD